MRPTQVVFLTTLAMVAFAGNSLLCRVALKGGAIDAASFTLVRIASGALVLGLILRGTPLISRRFHAWHGLCIVSCAHRQIPTGRPT